MAVHRFAGAEMLPNGDTVMGCWCGAWFEGPPDEVVDSYRNHVAEPAYPSEGAKP